MAQSDSDRERERLLAEIISTVSSTLELAEVLDAVVRLLSEASGVHACFVYLVEDEETRLVLRAASAPFGDLVGTIALERGKGLAWWAVDQREPAFIRDNAFDDPRFEHVPELGEEAFQSLIAVPILARSGTTIGAISLHTEAPREFTTGEVDFLVTSSSLVAGAVENARLFEESQRRVHQLEQLNALGEALARADDHATLLTSLAHHVVGLLDATASHVYTLDEAGEELLLAASAPPSAEAPDRVRLAQIAPELDASGSPAAHELTVALASGGRLRAALRIEAHPPRRFVTDDRDLARTAANQAALAIERLDLIAHLREENVIGDLLDDLSSGAPVADLASRARRLSVDLETPHAVLTALPAARDLDDAWADSLEAELLRHAPGALLDRRGEILRGLLRAPDPKTLRAAVLAAHEAAGVQVAVGLSGAFVGPDGAQAAFEESRRAALAASLSDGGPPVRTSTELGAYRYLLTLRDELAGGDPLVSGARSLASYDEERGTALLPTLAEYLRQRGNARGTAAALYVHPNTLRQRLRRIQELTEIDLAEVDWLALEIAVRLVVLEQLPTAD